MHTSARTLARYAAAIGTATLFSGADSAPAGAKTLLHASIARAAGTPATQTLPLQFELNRGQAGSDVVFVARGPGYGVALTRAGATITVNAHAGLPPTDRIVPLPLNSERRAVLHMTLAGALPSSTIRGFDALPGKVNYLIGSDPRHWQLGVATYAGVRYTRVYPGIDAIYRGTGQQLEYDFMVAPGSDPRRIRLAFSGAAAVLLDVEGNLLLRTPAGTIMQERPVIYQQVGGARRRIGGSYLLLGSHEVGFRLGRYDRRLPLIIDPTVVYSTRFGYHGGAGNDSAAGVKVDSAGNAYVVGTTSSGLAHRAIFVAKFDPSGTRLLYTTLISGACDTQAGGIAIDGAGNAYITGLYGSKDTSGICDVTQAVVARLTAVGAPTYTRLYGGHEDFQAKDWGNSIAVDQNGSAYVTGETDEDARFPTTAGAFQRTAPGYVQVKAFVLKVDRTGTLVYSTYLGGDNVDHGTAIAVDAHGDAYVTGQTASSNFPTTRNAFQSTLAGRGSLGAAFVTELNPSGSALIYSTYLTGDGAEDGTGIAVDTSGNAYVTGVTDSSHFPTTPNAYSHSCGQDGHCGLSLADKSGCSPACMTFNDAFMAEIDPDPRLPAKDTLLYATYLGGTLGDRGSGIAVDSRRHVYLAGTTNSTDFPTVAATQASRGDAQNALNPNTDAFVAQLDLTKTGRASLTFATYLGGDANDVATAIALGRAGTIFVAGTTISTDFPVTSTARGQVGGQDAFLAKLSIPAR